MRELVTLIVNPSAGAGRVLERWPELPAILGTTTAKVDVIAPATVTALADEARAAAAAGRTIIVAGGDGTVNRVLNAVSGFRVCLGVSPSAAATISRGRVGMPPDPLAAARRIAAGTATALDLVEANGRRFATVGGLGLVADASALVGRAGAQGRGCARWSARSGRHAYLLAAAAHIALERRTTTHSSPRVTAGRGVALGRSMPRRVRGEPAAAWRRPAAAGRVLERRRRVRDLRRARRTRRVRLARNLACLRGSRPVPEGALLVFRASSATMRVPRRVSFAADGEVFGAAAVILARRVAGTPST